MKLREYKAVEDYMLRQMKDSAHDKHHIYRVLYGAVDIAGYEKKVDTDVLIAACLLHDVGREKQFSDPSICHAQAGGEMALAFLLSQNWDAPKALHVKSCICSHRYRADNPPQSIEAQILFDADKLDVSGAVGIARTLIYQGKVAAPLYLLDGEGAIITESGSADSESFFEEYRYKLSKIYDSFYTGRAREIALARQKAAWTFT